MSDTTFSAIDFENKIAYDPSIFMLIFILDPWPTF